MARTDPSGGTTAPARSGTGGETAGGPRTSSSAATTGAGSPLVGRPSRVARWRVVSLALHCLSPEVATGRLAST